MKILHVIFMPKSGNGLKHQLLAEQKAVKELGIEWDIICFTEKEQRDEEEFMHQIPKKYSNSFLMKRIYFHLTLRSLLKHKKYDIILYRYNKADLIGYFLFRPTIKVLTIHHSKELDELKLNRTLFGRLLLIAEKFVCKRIISNATGIIAVTKEIALYQLSRVKKNKQYLIMSNGADTDEIDLLDDNRSNDFVNIAFIASFKPWHGLDLIINEMLNSNLQFKLHLIGNVPGEVKQTIKQHSSLNDRIVMHGYLNKSDLKQVISFCDIGLSSLALHRVNLSESCVLKVREYLASGIAVYGFNKDSGLPEGFPYYKMHSSSVNLNDIVDYATQMKGTSREIVRSHSIPFISKKQIIHNTYQAIIEHFN